MAKRKRSANRPQPQHRNKRQPSQHDRRARLGRRNPRRRTTTRAKFPLVGVLRTAVLALQAVLHPRTAIRLGIIAAGMMLADDRRTASSWFAAAGVLDDWDRFYDALITLGRQTEKLALVVLRLVVRKFDPGPGGRILLGVDDSPSQRYGRCVEGAGVHHHPTPGPADGEWLYGHVWVVLAWLQRHPWWGVIALPLRSLLYVRQMDVPTLDAKRGWNFRTKHQLAVELVSWGVAMLRELGSLAKVWVVADGAYAARPFLDPVRALGVVVVSRLRKDAKLFDLPPARKPGQRGRPRIYGANSISLAKRAAHAQGWSSITYDCRGVPTTCQYKTFLATSRLVRGVLRVVLVRRTDGWIPYFCTDPNASVCDILEAAASRWALEEHFHDVKEVWGAGQQQVRNVWSNIGCWHLNQWLFTLVELCTWDRPQPLLDDRRDRPWDNPRRRPSHADRRRSLGREMLHHELSTVLAAAPDPRQFHRLVESLLSLCL
jgi:Transposase DDE domain